MTKTFEPINVRGFSDDELKEAIEVAVDEIRKRAFVRGKRDLASKLAENHEQYEETLQQRRDKAVERAIDDLRELKEKMDSPLRNHYGNYTYQHVCTYARFVVNREKRTVVALVRHKDSQEILEKGIAKCYPNDCFNEHLGKVIALRRALGLNVPERYLNAPNPTKVRVGDVVRFNGYFCEVVPDYTDFYFTDDKCWITSAVAKQGVVVDDSNSERGE